MKINFLWTACLIAITGCDSPQNHHSRIESGETKTEKQLENLNFYGTYEGILPAADCEGIRTALTLNNDNTYVLRSEYIGEKDAIFEWLCHNKQLINSHFYRGVSELPYKLLFAVIYTHLEFRYEVSHTITSHHVHHFHQTRIPDGTLLDYMVQYRKPLFPQFFLYPKKFLPENNPHHKEFHLRPYIQNNANQ